MQGPQSEACPRMFGSRIDFFTATETGCAQFVDAQRTLGPRVRVTLKDANGVTTTLAN